MGMRPEDLKFLEAQRVAFSSAAVESSLSNGKSTLPKLYQSFKAYDSKRKRGNSLSEITVENVLVSAGQQIYDYVDERVHAVIAQAGLAGIVGNDCSIEVKKYVAKRSVNLPLGSIPLQFTRPNEESEDSVILFLLMGIPSFQNLARVTNDTVWQTFRDLPEAESKLKSREAVTNAIWEQEDLPDPFKIEVSNPQGINIASYFPLSKGVYLQIGMNSDGNKRFSEARFDGVSFLISEQTLVDGLTEVFQIMNRKADLLKKVREQSR